MLSRKIYKYSSNLSDSSMGAELISDLFAGRITLWQFLLAIYHWASPKRRITGDDFNWSSYSYHYRKELQTIENNGIRLRLEDGDFQWHAPGQLVINDPSVLLPSHHVLYESISILEPSTILEVGSGGGDHLRNLHVLFPSMTLTGYDRDHKQINYAVERNTNTPAKFLVVDISKPRAVSERFDVVYSHAVLMHISEKEGRFQTALQNCINLAEKALVLAENWTQHNFLVAVKQALSLANKDSWRVYIHESTRHPKVFALIASRDELSLEELDDYSLLLQGSKLRPH